MEWDGRKKGKRNGGGVRWSGVGVGGGGGEGGGGVEEEFAVGCVVEQIETDTHPQQESLTPSRKHTHTHSSMQNANTHTDKQTCKDTPETHAHTQDGELGMHAQRHTHAHDVWAGCGHSRCCP